MDYCNLRIFSHYSLFKSIIKIPDLINFYKKKNLPFVSICEEMNVFGFVEFSKLAKKSGLKPVFGCLLKIENLGLIPFFIKNEEGYHFLSYILSQFYIRNIGYIPLDDLKDQTGLICLIGGENSLFYKSNEENILSSYAERLKNIFMKDGKTDLFIEIQNLPNKNNLLHIAQKLEIPIVCTQPVNFLIKEDSESFYIFQCAGENKRYSSDEFINFNFANNFIQSRDSVEKLFYNNMDKNDIDLTEGFENSVQIAKKCNFLIKEHAPIIPKFEEDGEKDENIILRRHSFEGLEKRLIKIDPSLHETYKERLERELKVLKDKNFSGYFLVTADFVKKAKQMDIPVGPARGSGAGSLVAYSLTITDIDPIANGLIFERFLNPERNSMPDFDIDFCPKRRKEVVNYLKEKYGVFNIPQIVTFITLQPKVVLRDICRVCGVGFTESMQITALIPHDQINPISLSDAIKLIPQLSSISQKPKFKKIFETALKLEGIARNFSKHAAGILICDKPAWNLCPIFRDDHDDFVVSFGLKDIEYIGGVKFDFLGLRTLTVIDETIKKIKLRHNMDISYDSLPMKDQKTFDLFTEGNLDGVFQFDGAGIRRFVSQLKPDCFEDLVVMNALYRPGPIKNIPDYISRKHGEQEINFPHPLTEECLAPTLGIMVYQEQVMQIAKVCAGYTDGEADILRRAMGKKQIDEMKMQRAKFMKGAEIKGIKKEIAESLFDLMSEFSGYGFNKSHSAPYALIAYMCGYLKAHYPREFLCSFLSEEMTNHEKIIRFISNIKMMKIDILLPCVNESEMTFEIQDNAIRYGLGGLKNIGESAIETIILNRNIGRYLNIYDFVNKNIKILNKKNWESLVLSGSLDCFKVAREDLIDNLLNIKQGQILTANEKWTSFDKSNKERSIFGFHMNNYVEKLENSFSQIGWKTISQTLTQNMTSCFIAGEITLLKRKRVSDKTFYAFAEVLDSSGITYVAIFSKILSENEDKIKEGNFLIFHIDITRKDGNIKCVAKSVFTIDEFLEKPHNINILLKDKNDIEKVFNILKDIPKGSSKIIIHTEDDMFLLEEKMILDSVSFREKLEIQKIIFK